MLVVNFNKKILIRYVMVRVLGDFDPCFLNVVTNFVTEKVTNRRSFENVFFRKRLELEHSTNSTIIDFDVSK